MSGGRRTVTVRLMLRQLPVRPERRRRLLANGSSNGLTA